MGHKENKNFDEKGLLCGPEQDPCTCRDSDTHYKKAVKYQKALNFGEVKPSGALRYNSGKLRWMLLPVECIEEVIRILMKGAIKYSDGNWKLSVNTDDHDKFVNDRIESVYRHLAKMRAGEIYDDERLEYGQVRPTGIPYTNDEVDKFNSIKTTHAGAVAINGMFAFWYVLNDERKG